MFNDNRNRYGAGKRPLGRLSKPKDKHEFIIKDYLESLIPVEINSSWF